MSHPPFFVIGSPRSGTTLLRLLLTSHPALVVPPECGFVVWLHPTFGDWGVQEFSDPASLSRFAAEVTASRKFESWGVSLEDVENAIARRKPRDYSEACESVYRLFCTHCGKDAAIWGDKNNFYLAHIQTLKAIFSEARFIHIVRDGRDVACSYREVMGGHTNSPYRPSFPVTIDDIARQWSRDVQEIRKQLERLNTHQVIELRYEDLTAAPQRELTRICDWLRIPFDTDMLHFYESNRQNLLEPAATLDWKLRTLEPISTHTVGRHTVLLDQAEINVFLSIARSELQHYQYLI